MSFHDPEGYIDSTDYPPLPVHSYLECTYNVTVYTGYGVELQVRSASGGKGSLWPDTPALQQQTMQSTHSLGHSCPGHLHLLKKILPREKNRFFLRPCNK